MALFHYRAFDGGMVEVSGTIVADSPRHARDTLRGKGFLVEHVEPLREVRRRAAKLVSRAPNSARLTELIRELSTLLAVDIPLLQALDTVIQQQRGHFRDVLLRLRERVAGGASLAESMRAEPIVFDDLTVNITEVGERSGTLDEVLTRLAEFKERAGMLKGRIGNALIYPAIVLSMAFLIALLLMTFVVPNILEPLVEAGGELPLVTEVVKSMSDVLINYWWLLVVAGGWAAATVVFFLRSERGRLLWHRLQLRLPMIGGMVRRQSMVRIGMIIATLMRSGIAFLEALQIAKRSTSNRVMRAALDDCETAVTAGRDISEALDKTGAFSPTVVQVFAVGQQSGRLEAMLERLAVDYDQQLQSQAQRLTALLEPVMILILAFVVGFIAFATILPILEAGNVL